MKNILVVLFRFVVSFGCNPIDFFKGIKNLPWYLRGYVMLKKHKNKDFPISLTYPCLQDKDDDSGVASGHYYHQDLLVAQEIFKNKAERHIDIGSRVDGFVAHVASFRKIEVFDIRVLESKSKNIIFRQLDLMGEISDDYLNCTDSLSCLHTIEHFGLGRYGDTLDINGHLKGFQQMSKLLKKGGTFYFSTPISEHQRIEFNAHRVFSVKYLIEKIFKEDFEIISFSYVDDKGDLHTNIGLTEDQIDNSFELNYGCGIFELKKL